MIKIITTSIEEEINGQKVTTITNITANVDAALTDRAGIEQAIASALIQAQKRGMKVIL